MASFRAGSGVSPRRILHDTPQLRKAFHKYGLAGLSAQECANQLGCARTTIFTFFKRAPEVRDIYHKALDELHASAQEMNIAVDRVNAARLGVRAPLQLEPGQPCPTCGHDGSPVEPSDPETTIVIDTATLAEARRKLDLLYEKHEAARSAEQPE